MKESYEKLIRGKQWYHQRFDGSPMFLFAVGEAETRIEKRKPKGTEADLRVSFFSHGKGDWYLDMTDISRGAKAVIRLAKKNPDISTKLLKAWKKDEQRFEKFFWVEFPKIKFREFSQNEILELWERYYRLFIARFTSSSIIDHFALGTDKTIARMLRDEISTLTRPAATLSASGRGIGVRGQEPRFTEIFATATAPVHQSFINRAEIDLLKIVLKKSRMTLNEYQKKYFWTKNNYVLAQTLTIPHFKHDIRAWRQSGKDLKEELKRIEGTPRTNRLKKQKLFGKYKLSRLLRTLIKISEDFTWWQDERKKSTYWNIHIGCQVLKEIARRTGYHLEELKYAVAPEVSDLLVKRIPSRKELLKRMDSSVFIMTRQDYIVRTGLEAVRIKKIMLGSQSFDQIHDVRGLTASPGRAIGNARILKSSTEIAKVKPGDILIAVMTRPDYVPAMKRAGAIVTNEGGITSHAAIVSRELGIPCIIGTKIATEVFKDGDKVEVNANHGWIRKIK